jgi:RNA polymerase sigma factor (sigma-70 family)
MDWQHLVFDPQARRVRLLERIARRRFRSESLADEAFNFALERLSADGWAMLGGFQERAKPVSFLVAVYANLLEDFARARFGRPRPPAWLARLGRLWKQVFTWLCLERQEPESIVARLAGPEGPDPEEIDEMITVIFGRIPDCGSRRPEEIPEDEPDALSARSDLSPASRVAPDPETALTERDHGELLQALGSLLGGAEPVDGNPLLQDMSRGLAGRWSEIARAIDLSDEERLLLRLVYQDGRKFAAVGRLLGLPEHQVRRRTQRAVKRIGDVLRAAGYSAESIGSAGGK